MNAQQAFIFKILEPILTHQPEGRAIYAPQGPGSGRATCSASTSSRRRPGALRGGGPRALLPGRAREGGLGVGVERGGTLGVEDLASYEPIARYPARGGFRGRDVLTNPPPSSGGILVAFGLDLLERLGARRGRAGRGGDGGGAGRPHRGVSRRACRGRLARAVPGPGAPRRGRRARPARLRPPAGGVAGPGDRPRLDDPYHRCRRRRPLRQRHLLERHRLGPDRPRDRGPRQQHARRGGPEPARLPHPARRAARALDDVADRACSARASSSWGSAAAARTGSAPRSCRRSSGWSPTGWRPPRRSRRRASTSRRARSRPSRASIPRPLARLEARGYAVARWAERNLFFGGVHAVARDPETGELRGGGDPRRGGAIAVV